MLIFILSFLSIYEVISNKLIADEDISVIILFSFDKIKTVFLI